MKYEKLLERIHVCYHFLLCVLFWIYVHYWLNGVYVTNPPVMVKLLISGILSLISSTMVSNWILAPLLDKFLRRKLYKYEEQIIILQHIEIRNEEILRVVSVFDKTVMCDIQIHVTLCYYNRHLQSDCKAEISKYQAQQLCKTIRGTYFNDEIIITLKDTRMYKHEFDSLMMMYAIDNLTELQKRIAP